MGRSSAALICYGEFFRDAMTATLELENMETAKGLTTVGMHYEVVPGKEEEFEQGFLGVLDHLKGIEGHVESHLYEDVASVGSYVILSEWSTKEAFTRFIQSPAFKNVTAWGKAEILRGRPRHKVYQGG